MREIVMDTETTGLDPSDGHRILEIGAVEIFNLMPTGQVWHRYINPERAVPSEAVEIHGIDDAMLVGKPIFARIAGDFLKFIGDAPLVIHNASFDIRFLNAEFARLSLPALPANRAIDTLMMARQRFPGSPASLDALCRRFGIDNSGRQKHGALLDSELLAEVYLELRGGRQPDLTLSGTSGSVTTARDDWRPNRRATPLSPRLTEAERAAHEAFVQKMGEKALWNS
jgi:DNA polymerase III subunit epsilon